MSADSIDAVITWVDGNEPAHLERLNAHLSTLGGRRSVAADPTRFNDAGELAFCLASLLRFTPWLRRIHLVTDRQQPPWWPQVQAAIGGERLRLVDHRELFAGYEDCLPTFNSLAIGSVLWRIDGLADQFLFLNDDFVLLQPLQPRDFFDAGRVVLRGDWRVQSTTGWRARLHSLWRRWRERDPARQRFRHRTVLEHGAQAAGELARFLQLRHTPYPMRRSTLDEFFSARPDLLRSNVGERLRSERQFNPESLAVHLEWRSGRSRVEAYWRDLQIKPAAQSAARIRAKLRRADRDPRFAFACIQSLELADPALQADIRAWLHARVGGLPGRDSGCEAGAAPL